MKGYRTPIYKIHRRLISHLSIAVLILNIGLANAAVSKGEKILLCTAQGYVWVTLSEAEGKTHSDPLTANSVNIHKCPFCTFNPDDNDGIIQSFYGPKPYSNNPISISTDHGPLLSDKLYYSSLHSRAPPMI